MPGLKGQIAGDQSITFVDYNHSRLYFRGYTIEDLTEHCTFEEVFWLLVKGELPKERSRTWLYQNLAEHRSHFVLWEARNLLEQPFINSPMHTLAKFVNNRGALRSPMDQDDLKNLSYQAVMVGEELLAVFPIVIAHLIRWGTSPPRFKTPWPIVKPHPGLNTAGNFLWMLRGEYPTRDEERALDMALILHADHEFNASTFAMRTCAAAGADPYAAFATGINVLSGIMHGGANAVVMRMFERIQDPKYAAEFIVDHMVNKDKKVFGFGHRLYKKSDPRVAVLKHLAQELCRKNRLPWYDIARNVEKTTKDILRSRGKEFVPANVDFYSPALFAALGIPWRYMPLMFAMGRIAGWTAHMKEQYEEGVLIRPLSNYNGPSPRPLPKKYTAHP